MVYFYYPGENNTIGIILFFLYERGLLSCKYFSYKQVDQLLI